jgi:hypothetical protein
MIAADTNLLPALHRHALSVWLDFLACGFFAQGGLKGLADESHA